MVGEGMPGAACAVEAPKIEMVTIPAAAMRASCPPDRVRARVRVCERIGVSLIQAKSSRPVKWFMYARAPPDSFAPMNWTLEMLG